MLRLFMKKKSHSNVTCDYSFSRKSVTKSHVASVHGGKKIYLDDQQLHENDYNYNIEL